MMERPPLFSLYVVVQTACFAVASLEAPLSFTALASLPRCFCSQPLGDVLSLLQFATGLAFYSFGVLTQLVDSLICSGVFVS